MAQESTSRKLAGMTDAGLFERLATAILRISDDRCCSLNHPGVNANGKTVKSPVDGITFVPGSVPPQMITVHHTICAAKDLEKKWCHDPAKVKPRNKSNTPTAPAGDIIKTIEIIEEEKKRTPNLQATLILTTNQEPSEELIRDVHATSIAARITIEIWGRSRLVDVLDNDPRGQWLRRQYLGIDQILLSEEKLSELSKKSLDRHCQFDDPEAWISRDLDIKIEEADKKQIVFVVAESGLGKTVACYKRLRKNHDAGGFSLVLTEEVIASSLSLEQAVEKSLLQLDPSLMVGCGEIALKMSAQSRRLLLTVEDINRSGSVARLIEKISRWESDKDSLFFWQLLCPVWPKLIPSLSDEERKRISDMVVAGTAFSGDEGANAVEHRYKLLGYPITKLDATKISDALGRDPLLIALHDPARAPNTLGVIAQFTEASLQRLTTIKNEFSPAEYSNALIKLAKMMLLKRQLEPSLLALSEWPELISHVPLLRHVVHHGEVIRLVGSSTNEKIVFRHDRVREWLLVQAAFDMLHTNTLPEEIIAEPHFAEILGLVLVCHDISTNILSVISTHNPLALFCAIPHFHRLPISKKTVIVNEIESWLNKTSINARRHNYLYWEAMKALAEAEDENVLPLVARLKDNSWNALRARYRNGNLMGGIGLCLLIEPGVNAAGHNAFLDHVKTCFGMNLISALTSLLNDSQLTKEIRIGALRLAGHIGEPELADAIRICWKNDASRHEHLDEYLWACAQCVDNDPITLLDPVCDNWALLSNEEGDRGMLSPRDSLVESNLRFAFQKKLPDPAVLYFIRRANNDPELRWPITYMLHGVDQPDALEFIVRELAAIDERLEGTGQFSPFRVHATDHWRRHQEESGRPMSKVSRKRLQVIWQDQSNNKYLRKQAFRIWASTHHMDDLNILCAIPDTDILTDAVLWQRLRLGDHKAIPAFQQQLSKDDHGHWWQLVRYIWSSDLSKVLDKALENRKTDCVTANLDWVLSEVLIAIPTKEAEALLNKHWDLLCSFSNYVVAALYIATPSLINRVATTMQNAADPKELLKHFPMFGSFKSQGDLGTFLSKQIEVVMPYIDLLSEHDIRTLWSACNKHGLFELRRTNLDSKLSSTMREWAYIDASQAEKELDKFSEKNRQWQLNQWLDDYLKSGITLDDVMATIGRWFKGRADIDALQLASAAVLHVGERRHLQLLRNVIVEPAEEAAAIIADTEFGVYRRTLLT